MTNKKKIEKKKLHPKKRMSPEVQAERDEDEELAKTANTILGFVL